MKIVFKKLITPKNTIKISLGDGQPEKEYKISEIRKNGIHLPETAQFNEITIKGQDSVITEMEVDAHIDISNADTYDLAVPPILLKPTYTKNRFEWRFQEDELGWENARSYMSDENIGFKVDDAMLANITYYELSLSLQNYVFADGTEFWLDNVHYTQNPKATQEEKETFEAHKETAMLNMIDEIRSYSNLHDCYIRIYDIYFPIIFDLYQEEVR
jgi:hypothetical protein